MFPPEDRNSPGLVPTPAPEKPKPAPSTFKMPNQVRNAITAQGGNPDEFEKRMQLAMSSKDPVVTKKAMAGYGAFLDANTDIRQPSYYSLLSPGSDLTLADQLKSDAWDDFKSGAINAFSQTKKGLRDVGSTISYLTGMSDDLEKALNTNQEIQKNQTLSLTTAGSKNLFEDFNLNSFAATMGNGLGQVAAAAAPMLAGAFAGPIGIAAGRTASFVVSSAQMYGQLLDDFRAKGISAEQAALYAGPLAAILGVVETALPIEQLVSKATSPLLSKAVIDPIISNIATKGLTRETMGAIEKAAFSSTKQYAKAKAVAVGGAAFEQGAVEFAEEFSQGYIEDAGKKLYDYLNSEDKFKDIDMGSYAQFVDNLQDGIVGSMIGGHLGAGVVLKPLHNQTLYPYLDRGIQKGDLPKRIDALTKHADFLLSKGKLEPEKHTAFIQDVQDVATLAQQVRGWASPTADAQTRFDLFQLNRFRENYLGMASQLNNQNQQLTQQNVSLNPFEQGKNAKVIADNDMMLRFLNDATAFIDTELTDLGSGKKTFDRTPFNIGIQALYQQYAVPNQNPNGAQAVTAPQSTAIPNVPNTNQTGGVPAMSQVPPLATQSQPQGNPTQPSAAASVPAGTVQGNQNTPSPAIPAGGQITGNPVGISEDSTGSTETSERGGDANVVGDGIVSADPTQLPESRPDASPSATLLSSGNPATTPTAEQGTTTNPSTVPTPKLSNAEKALAAIQEKEAKMKKLSAAQKEVDAFEKENEGFFMYAKQKLGAKNAKEVAQRMMSNPDEVNQLMSEYQGMLDTEEGKYKQAFNRFIDESDEYNKFIEDNKFKAKAGPYQKEEARRRTRLTANAPAFGLNVTFSKRGVDLKDPSGQKPNRYGIPKDPSTYLRVEDLTPEEYTAYNDLKGWFADYYEKFISKDTQQIAYNFSGEGVLKNGSVSEGIRAAIEDIETGQVTRRADGFLIFVRKTAEIGGIPVWILKGEKSEMIPWDQIAAKESEDVYSDEEMQPYRDFVLDFMSAEDWSDADREGILKILGSYLDTTEGFPQFNYPSYVADSDGTFGNINIFEDLSPQAEQSLRELLDQLVVWTKEVEAYNKSEFPPKTVFEYATDRRRNQQGNESAQQAVGETAQDPVSSVQGSEVSAQPTNQNDQPQSDTVRPSQDSSPVRENPAAPTGESGQNAVAPKSESQTKIDELRQRKSELAKKFADALAAQRGQLNSGIDPTVLAIGIEYVGVQAQLGFYKIAQIVEDFVSEMGLSDPDTIKALKGAYSAYRDGYATDEEAAQMDSSETVRAYNIITNTNEQVQATTATGQTGNSSGGILPDSQPGTVPQNEGQGAIDTVPQMEGANNDRFNNGLDSSQPNDVSPSGGVSLEGVYDAARPTDTGTDPTIDERQGGVEETKRELPEPKPGEAVIQVKNRNNFVLPPDIQHPPTFSVAKKFDDNIAALETLLKLLEENRKATPEEQMVLAQYVGFGGLKDVLNYNPSYNKLSMVYTGNPAYKMRVAAIYDLTKRLDPEGRLRLWASIRASTLSAYFTPFQVIRGTYDILQKAGFKGGRILEPSMGIGNFFGVMPTEWSKNSNLFGVEKDWITGKIAQTLYPDANIQIKGFEEANFPENYFDLSISNVPFGDFGVTDNAWSNRRETIYKTASRLIHDYFAVKMIESTRPGGLIVLITSKGTLDKQDIAVRKYMSDKTEFLGALRLPETTFEGNANTSVVTDMIFLKKKTESSPVVQRQSFLNTVKLMDVTVWNKKKFQNEKVAIMYNEYFAANPQNVLGTLTGGGQGRESELNVVDSEGITPRLEQVIAERGQAFVNEDTFTKVEKSAAKLNAGSYDAYSKNQFEREGSMVVKDGKVGILRNDTIDYNLPVKIEPQLAERYGNLRKAFFELLYGEINNLPDDALTKLRKELDRAYSGVKTLYGTLSANARKLSQVDADFFRLQALEKLDQKGVVIGKADIFTKRTINPNVRLEKALTPRDAVLASLAETGVITPSRMVELLGEDWFSQVADQVFEVPEGGYQTKEVYLSGNVRKKLAEATRAAQLDQRFAKNVEALTPIIPADIPSSLIEANLGSAWVPADVYQNFATQTFGGAVDVSYTQAMNYFAVNASTGAESAPGYLNYSTTGMTAEELLNKVLNNQEIKVMETKIEADGTKKIVVNMEQTAAAQAKAVELKQAFEMWLWTDAARSERLGRIYNDTFNANVNRQYDGSFLTLPGYAGWSLRPHQKNALWMLLQNGGGLVDHSVGLGKTLLMITGAMEMRRLGIAKKPMIAAMKANINQIAAEFRASYPAANILYVTEKDFEAKNRISVLNRISTNDWDCVIITHDQLKKIPHDVEIQKELIYEEIAQLEEAIQFLASERGGSPSKREEKALEKRKQNLAAKLEELSKMAKDDVINFQQMGVDHLFVDESQVFKNLGYTTRLSGVAGLGKPVGSKSTFHLLTTIRSLQKMHQDDKGTTFLSGTPLSNSISEMYLLSKYLRPTRLQELGLTTFDAWVSTFARQSTEIEFDVTGQLKSKNRLRQFINVPELSGMYLEFSDVKDGDARDEAGNQLVPKPSLRNGEPTFQLIKPSDQQQKFMLAVIAFAKEPSAGTASAIGKGWSEGVKSAKMLIATTEAAKAAIDIRLVDKNKPADEGSKITACAQNIADIYKESTPHKGTQLVFCDLGTPKAPDFRGNMEEYLLNELGFTEEQVVRLMDGITIAKTADLRKKLIEDDELGIDPATADDIIKNVLDYTNNPDSFFNVYNETKKQLTEKHGIPENEVVFIHDYKTDKSRRDLFDAVNRGDIRVVIGSTSKLGTGVNVQQRIVAMHHLDIPWRPSDYEQRNGRGLRQGNKVAKEFYDDTVNVFIYGAERSLDAYKFELLRTKAYAFQQIKSGASGQRVLDEGSADGLMGMADMIAAISGNPAIKEKAVIDKKVQQLSTERRGFLNTQASNVNKFNTFTRLLEKARAALPFWEKDVEEARALNFFKNEKGENNYSLIQVNGRTEEKAGELGKAIQNQKYLFPKSEDVQKGLGHLIAKVGPFGIYGVLKNSFGESTAYIIISANNGTTKYEFQLPTEPVPTAVQLFNNLSKISPSSLELAREDIKDFQSKVTSFDQLANQQWPKEQELKAALEEQKRVNAVMEQITAEQDKASEQPTDDVQAQAQQSTFKENTTPQRQEIITLAEEIQQSFPNVQLITDTAEIDRIQQEHPNEFVPITSNGELLGFNFRGKVYIDPRVATTETAIHEFGHVWADVAEQEFPAQLERGISLVRGTAYEQAVRDEYPWLKDERLILKEALVRAIGEKGQQLKSQSRLERFADWLGRLFRSIGEALGMEISQDTMLSDFANEIASELLSGQQISDITSEALARIQPVTQAASKGKIRGLYKTPLAGMKFSPLQLSADRAVFQNAIEKAEKEISKAEKKKKRLKAQMKFTQGKIAALLQVANNKNTTPTMLTYASRRVKQLVPTTQKISDDLDRLTQYVQNQRQQIDSYETSLKSIDQLVKSSLLVTDNSGKTMYAVVDPDSVSNEMEAVSTDRIAKQKQAGILGKLHANVFQRMMPLLEPHVIADYLFTKGSVMHTVMGDTVRALSKKVGPMRVKAHDTMRYFTTQYGNICTYRGIANPDAMMKQGLIETVTTTDGRKVEIPMDYLVSMVAEYKTQMAEYGESSMVEGGGTLIQDWRNPTKHIPVKLDETEMLRLEELVDNNYRDLLAKIKEYFDFVLPYIQETYINLEAKPLKLAKAGFYFPIRYQSELKEAALDGQDSLKRDAPFVRQRKGLNKTDLIVTQSVFEIMNRYMRGSENYVQLTPTAQNFNLVKSLTTPYMMRNGMMSINKVIENMTIKFDNPMRDYERQTIALLDPKKAIGLTTLSRFAFNIALPLKNLTGYSAALGQGIIEDKYLKENMGFVFRAFGNGYKRLFGNIPKGFGEMTGTFQMKNEPSKEILDTIAEMYANPEAGPILSRVLNDGMPDLNTIEWATITATSSNNTARTAIRRYNQMVDWLKENGLTAQQQADSAVMLGFWRAANAQVAATMQDQPLDVQQAEVARLANELMYATNATFDLTDKSSLQLSGNLLWKMFTLYQSQGFKVFSTLMKALNTYIMDPTPENKKRLVVNFVHTMVYAPLYIAMVNIFISFARAWDDEEKQDQILTIDNALWEAAGQFTQTVPGATSFWADFAVSSIDNRPWDAPIGSADFFEPLNKGGKGLLEAMSLSMQDFDDPREEREAERKIRKGFQDAAIELPTALGMPRELLRILNQTVVKPGLEED